MVPLPEKLPENFVMLIKTDAVTQKLDNFEYYIVDLGYSWRFNGVGFQGLFAIKSVKRYARG